MADMELVKKELDLLSKTYGLDSEKIQRAFSQMGNLLDLLYLEISVLIEINVNKGLFTKEEFTKDCFCFTLQRILLCLSCS